MNSAMSKLILLLQTLVLTVFVSCAQEPSSSIKLEQVEFIQKIESDSTVQVIDVRTPDEYASGHIQGAQSINFFDKDFQEQIKTLDLNKPVYVYCAAGGRSGKACKVMESLGFKAIYDLKGGYHN